MNYREIENKFLGGITKDNYPEVSKIVKELESRRSVADHSCHHIISTMGDHLDDDPTNPFQIWFDHVSDTYRNTDRLIKIAGAYGWI